MSLPTVTPPADNNTQAPATVNLQPAEQIAALQARIRELEDTDNGYRGRQGQLEQENATLTAHNTELQQTLSRNEEQLARIPELEAEAGKASRLLTMSELSPDLMANTAMRDLILSSTMDEEQLRATLEGAQGFLADFLMVDDDTDGNSTQPPADNTQPPADGNQQPPAQTTPATTPPAGQEQQIASPGEQVLQNVLAPDAQFPGPIGQGAGFGGARTIGDIEADIAKAVADMDTAKATSLMNEKLAIMNQQQSPGNHTRMNVAR